MQLRSIILAAGAALSLSVPGQGAEVHSNPKAVLELFTSQGCSSCPGADALLTQYGQRGDIITLAYHVDYWDYIGWADTFGAASNTELQRAYASSWGTTKIYTPQIVVNGAKGVVGSRSGEVDGALAGAALTLPVDLAVTGDMLKLDIAGKPGGREAMVWIVTLKSNAQVVIERGENAGRTMDYTQIVTGRHVLGMWEPGDGTHLKLPLAELLPEGSDGAVILVQEESGHLPGPILGAASFTL